MHCAVPVLGYVWLGNTGKRTFHDDYCPTSAVMCGHLYLLFNASTGSTGNQPQLTRLIAGCSPVSLTTGAVEIDR